ncbi:autotransporter-associated beta strand repeat-containing protein [Blastomonas sp. SL216]|uniref:autotransporter-associated beta strand repeat-containing protein n=1 Tax=Blastomonas sp. SL216 TaxID=2995169 RepID=UPI0023777519|nr:autotransporter-associated beta strand repeat-containing protein [Blastomonas sp. SL216]
MQSIRNSGADRSERRAKSMPQRHGLFSSTALIPAIAALAGGVIMLPTSEAQAQTLVDPGTAANGFGDNSLCLDSALDLCPIDLGAINDTTPPVLADLSTGRAGRSLLMGGDNGAQIFSINADGDFEYFSDFNQNTLVLNKPITNFIVSGNSSQLGAITESGGARALRKTGSARLDIGCLGGCATNTYSGGTIIAEGFLGWDRDNAFGAAGTSITIDGGAGLLFNGTFSTNRPITLSGGTATISAFRSDPINHTGTISGVISGSGALRIGGNAQQFGTVVLSGANSYQGGTTLASGTLSVSSDGNLGASGTGVSIGNATFAFGGSFSTSRPFDLTGQAKITVGTGLTGTITSAISGNSGSLDKLGAGTLVLSGTNSYRFGTTIAGGTLQIEADANLGAAGLFVSISDGAGLTFANNSFATTRAITLSGTGGTITVNPSLTTTLNGVIQGGAGLTKSGAGTLILTNANSYAGTTINAGTLQIGSGGTTGTLGLGDVTNNATLTFNRSNDLTVSNAISGGGSVIKNGAGTVILTGANTYSGTTTISAGTLQIGNGGTSGVLGSGQVTNSGTLVFNRSDDITVANVLANTLNGVVVKQGAGMLTLTGDLSGIGGRVEIAGGTLSLGNASGLGAPVTFTGSGMLRTAGNAGQPTNSSIVNGITVSNGVIATLAAANSRTLTINGNFDLGTAAGTTLRFGAAGIEGDVQMNISSVTGTLGNSSVIAIDRTRLITNATFNQLIAAATGGLTVTAGATLDVNGTSVQANNLTGNGLITNFRVNGNTNFTAFQTASSTYGGVIASTIGTLSLTVAGTGGPLILTGTSTYNGGTTINAGATLQLGNGITSGAITQGSFANNGTLVLNPGGAFTFDRTVTGTGTLIKRSTNTATITSNLQQGAITVEAGTLALSGTNTIGGITVSGGMLQLASNAAAGGAGGQITTTGSVIDFANGITNATPILLNSNTTRLQVTTGTATQSGIISETGGARPLEKIGAGALVLSGLNSYSGGTLISGGTLSIGSDENLGASGTGIDIGNATFQFNNSFSTTRAFTLTGTSTISVDATRIGTINGNIAGVGSLTKTSSGTLVLTNGNSYEGGTTISAGVLQIGNGGTTGTLGRDDIANNASLVFNRSNDLTVANRITGTGTLTKQGAGTLVLNGLNTYAGGTTISAGTLQLGSVGGSSGTVGNGSVSIAALANLRFDGGGNKVVSGAISGDGSITVAGTGSAILDNANNPFTGGTTVNAGTLALAAAGSAGTGTIRMNGGALQANSSFTLTNRLTVAQGADVRIVTAPGVTLTKTGDGTNPLDLVGTLRIATTGTGANAGTFRFSSAATTAETARLIIESGTLLNTTSVVLPALLNVIELTQIDAAGTLNLGGVNFSGTDGIKNLQGSGTLINSGATTRILGGSFSGSLSGTQNIISTGTLSLSGTSDFTGTTTVQSGKLTVSSAGALGTSASGTTVNSGATLEIVGSSPSLVVSDALTISGTGVGGTGALRVVPNANPGFQGVSLSGGVTLAANATITNTDRMLLLVTGSPIQLGASTLTFNAEGTGNSTLRLNSVISGTGGLIKNGASAMDLNGANTFTGPFAINGGDVSVNGGAALADTVAVSMSTGTRLFVNSSETIGSLAGAGSVNFQNNSILTTGGTNTSTSFAGNILGMGSLTKLGTGTFTLSGTNSYSGGTTISAGALAVGSDTALGTGALTMAAGTTLEWAATGNRSISNAINLSSGNGFSVSDPNFTLNLGGVISGTSGFTVTGAGIVAVTGNNLLAGTITISAGILSVGNGGTSGTLGTANVVNNTSLQLNRSDNVTLSNVISGTGFLFKNGSGTLTLSGDNSYSGITRIFAGTLQIGDGGTSGSLGSGSVFLENDSSLLFNRSDNITVASSIGGGGPLTKLGAGTLTLTGANNYVGTTIISAGTLQIGNGGTTGTLSTTAGTPNLGNVVNNAALVFNRSNDLTVANAVSGSGSLTKLGAGTLTLTGRNTYDGVTTVSAGTLVALRDSSLGTAVGNTIVANGATLQIVADGPVAESITINGTGVGGVGALRFNGATQLNGAVTLGSAARINTDAPFSAVLAGGITGDNLALTIGGTGSTTVNSVLALGTGNLVKDGTGTLVLAGNNTFGTTTINSGTLRIGNGGTTGTLGSGNVLNNFALVFNRSNDFSVSNAISGGGTLTKQGAGNLTLSGANAYSGLTTVSAGTLTVNSDGALGSNVAGTTVSNGATLAFGTAGTIADAISFRGTGVGGVGALNALGSVNLDGNVLLEAAGLVSVQNGQLIRFRGSSFGALGNAVLTLNTDGNSSIFVNSAVSGIGGLIKNGAGQVQLAGNNSFTGPVTINAGVLQVTGGNAINDSVAITGVGSGRLSLDASETIGSIAGTGSIGLFNNSTLTTGGNNSSTSYSGQILSTGSLVKLGTGTFTLTGDSSYLGTTTISGGTLQIGDGGTTGTLGSGAVTNNATLAINLSSDITLAQLITGTGALRKLGAGVATLSSNLALGSATVEAGTLLLSGSNSFTNGITVAGGTLALRSTNAAGGATGLIRTTGSVIDYGDGLVMATPIQLNSNTTQLQVLAGSATQSGVISEIGGARPLEKIGAGTLTLSGANTYSGGTTITAGRLNIASDANLGNGTGRLTIGNAVLGVTSTLSSGRAVSLTGAAGIDVASGHGLFLFGLVSGLGGLTKTGTGSLFLIANNGYAGPTTVSGGDLIVGGGSTTGTLGAGNVVVNNGSTLQFNRSDAFTVANTISGAGLVAKQGTGVMTLTGANSFSGSLSILGGAVVLDHATAGVIDAAGTGRISLSSNTILRTDISGSLANNLTFRSGNSTVAAATGTTLRLASNQISFEAGAGSPLNFGAATATGTVELAPTIVLVGSQVNPININGITLRLANTGAYTLLNGSNGVFLNGATLGADFAGTLTKPLTVSATGSTIDVAAASLTLQGANSYNGVLTKTGAGELRLTGAGTGSSTVQLNAGTLALLSTDARWGTGTLQMATGTTLRLGLPSPATLANNIVLGAGAGSTIIASSTTFSGALSGGALTIASGLGTDGPSVVRLTGTNSYGATTIGAGNTLLIGTVASGGTLGTGNVTINSGATLRFEGNNDTVGNVISGAGRLVRDGIGTTTLTAVNSYAGGTLISGGGIAIGNAGALGSGALTMTGTSSLTTATGVSATVTGVTIGNFASSSISAAAGQTLALGGTLDLSSFANSLVFGTLVQTGTVQIGFAPATGPVTNASMRIDAGTLRLGSASDAFLLRLGGGMTIGSPGGILSGLVGTLDLNGFAGGGVNLNGLGAITNSSATGAQFEALQNAASTFGGTIGGGTGAISLLKSGTGALTLTGANTYSGTTSITGGSLQIGNGGTTGSLGTGAVSIASGAQLLLNRSDAVSMANIFTGAGAVQKNLANTLTLTGSNTGGNAFTGTFNVNGGMLLVNGTLGDVTNRAATINVASGAALGGSGTIQGNVVVANGGILSPGNSPATQTIAGNLTLNASSVLNFELAQAGVVGGGINDLISVGGNLVLDGTLNVTALPGFGAGFYRLFNYGGTLTNNTLNLGTLPLGFTSSILTDIAGQVNILFNAGAQTVQYWDGTDLTGAIATVNGDGGAGSWTSAATNWTNPTGFAVNSSWAGQAGVFAGAAGGTIGITGSQAFQELRLLTSGYTLNANNAASGLATTGGFSIINVDSGIATLINAPISGSAGLTKTGGGTLTLAGANSYAGLTTVSGGTLSLTSGGAIAGAVQNNATLTNAGTISGLVTNAGTLTSTGTLAGGLTNNAGTTANVAGSFGGNAIVNSGTLTLTGVTGGIGAVTQNVGGTINLGGQSVSFGSLAGTGTINQSGPGVLTIGGNNASTSFAGNFTGSSGSIVKTGTGTQTLSGSSSWGGLTTVDGGTLSITGAGSLAGQVLNRASFTNAGIVAGSVINSATLVSTGVIGGGLTNNAGAIASIAGQLNGAVTNTGTITLTGITTGMTNVENNGTLNLAGFDTSIGSLGGSGGIALGNGLLTVGASNGAQLFDGIISGTGGLVKVNAASTLELRGANSYAGLTTISGGRLTVSGSGRLAGPVQNNATFIVDDGVIAGLVTNAGTLVSTGALNGGLVNSSGANAGLRGTLNGPVSNSGTITLTGITTGNAAVRQTGTGTFNMAGFNATIGSLAGSGQVQLGSGTLTLGGANTSTDFAGVISGSGSLVKTGTGTQTLSGANTFAGLTSITQGSIVLATGGSLASAVQNNATFINAGTTAGLVTNAGTLTSTGTLGGGLINTAGATANLANAVNGAITNSGAITLTAGLSGSPTFTQNAGASLNLAGFSATLGSIAGSGAIQLGSGTLTAGSNNSSTSFDGVISGSGSFTKTGSGALTLGGSNTAESNFTGTVTVNSGSLVLNGRLGDAVANSATLNIANGATLSGSGTFLGNLALGTGGIFAPGNSPGTLAIGGNLLLDATSVLNFELAQAGVVGGGINDLITVGGNLTLDGTLNVAALPGFGDGIYRLVNYAGALTDNGLAFGLRPDGYTASLITNVAGQVSVQFTLGVPTVLYWDGADTTAASNAVNGNGGSGTWNSTTTNWTSAPGFSTSFAWGSQTGVFAGAAGGTVQVSGTQAFQQLRFETGGYVLGTAAGGGALATTGGTSIIDVSAGLAATIDTPIQGTAGLTKAGTGTLTLGGANSYAGLTSIAAGTLALSSGGVIAGAVDNAASFSNAGTVAGQVTNRASLTSTGALNGGLVNNAGATASLAGTVTGAVSNAGTIVLTGATTGIGALVQTGGALDLAGFNTSIGSLAGSGSVALGNGTLTLGSDNASTSFAGVITGNGGLTKTGSGAFTLTGANTFSGGTTVSAGQLTLAAGASLAGAVINNASFVNSGTVAGSLTNNGTATSNGILNLGLTNTGGATAFISGQLNGAVTNSGTITLTGLTTGMGSFNQSGGTLNLAGFGTTIGSLGGSGAVQLGTGGSLVTGGNNTTTTFSGVISGNGSLTKTGTGTFTMSGLNTFTGLTTVNGGLVQLTSSGAIAGAVQNNASFTNSGAVQGLVTNAGALRSTGTLAAGLTNNVGAVADLSGVWNGTVSNAGTVRLIGSISGNATFNQLGTGVFDLAGSTASIGALSGAGSVQLGTGSLAMGSNNASTSFTGVITGSGGIEKLGTGTFTLTGANTFAGRTLVSAGSLTLASGGSLAGPVTNSAVFTNAGTVAGAVTNSGTLVSTGAINGGLINNAGASANISGVLAGNAINRGTITLTGATTGIAELSMATGATFNLGGFATTIGNLTGGGGTIALGSATLTLGSGNQSQTYDGTITGTGGLTKVSASTFSLSGAQGYTGLTSVNGGTFILGSNGLLAGALANNATVSTNGRIAGLVTNNATLTSTGALDGGLVNAAGASASIRGTLAGAVSNAGSITLTGSTTGIGAVTQASTGSFDTAGISTSFGSLAGSGTVRLANGAVLTTGGNNGSTSFGGLITGNGGLTKAGTGTFTLTAVQDFTGLTTVGAGTLAIGTGASLAGGVTNNATLTNAGTIAGAVTNTGALVSTGTLSSALTNAAGATAQIAGLLDNAVSNAGTITLTGTTTGIGAVTQDATGVFALGGFNTSIGSLSGSGSVQLGAGVLTTGGDNSTTSFGGVLSGTGGLIKTGNGSFALSGANSYAGLTTVNQGVLSVRNNAALGTAAAGTVVAAGAALELQGGVTVNGEALTISGTGVGGAGALRNVADNNIWAGTVSLGSDSLITADAGRLDIELLAGTSQALTTGGAGLIGLANATSAGTLIVTGGSTALFGTGNFAAGVTVNAGNLFLQGGTSIDDAAAVTLGTGNLIVAVSETIGSLAGAGGTVQIDAGQTLSLGGNNGSTSFGGVIFNTGNLAKQGTGTFTVTGLLAHSGTTAITGGTLLSGAANIWSGNGLVTIATGGTLDLGGFEQGIGSISLAGGTLANGALTGSISSSGGTIRDISGTANALRAIGGTTTLTGAGSFAQGVTLAGGDVVLQGAGASIADSALVTVDTGTLAVNVGETIGALAGSGGRVQIAAGQTLTTGGSNPSTAYAGVLAGNGAVIKTGAGTFTLSGANTLTGPITVNAGVLALASGASLAGAVQNNAGFSNAGTVAGLVTNSGTLISTGVLGGGLVNSGSAGLSGQLNGAVSNSGLVQLQGALTGITGFNQTANGMFDLAGFNTSIGSLSGAGSVLLGSATLTLGSSNASTSFGGTIGGTGGLIKTGSGTFTLTSGQGYTGLTTVNAGLLSLTANAGLSGSVLNNAGFASSGLILGSLTNNGTATLAGQINGAVINGGSITASGQLIVQGRLTQNAGGSTNLAGFNASLGSLAGVGPIQLGSGTLVVGSDNSSSLFSGVISGSGGLQKLGTGTFTLTGINSYTGVTLVNAGTLVIGEGGSVGGTTGSVTATVAAPSSVSAPVAVAASAPLVAEQARMPEAVTLLAATSATADTGPAFAAATSTAATASPSLAARAGMIVDNGAIAGGLTPASLTSSAERLPLAGGVSSGPERVDLFGDPVSGAVLADLPVVTLGEAAQSVAPAAASAASSEGRLAMLSDLSNGLGTARLDNGLGADALQGDAEMASPVTAALLDPAAPAASAGEAAMAGTLSTAVIAGSVLNNAGLINHGSILGQLVNSAGATAVNNGVIRGLVTNNGTFTSVGTLSGGLANSGTARISGVLTGDVFNSGSITLTGLTTGIALFQQAATGSLNLGGFDTTLGVLSGAGTVTLGSARLTTGTNGVNSLFSGVISGSGALTKTGTGGLILDGENSYTGGTTIAGGTLQLGNGGTTGSIIGPVLNNGALIINRSNGYTFASTISGTGMFVQAGTGTTTLTGANSYSGGTLISAGRLIGSTVSLQGLIQNDAALEFAQGTNGVFAGRIGGTGLFDKTGAGLLELTGDNSALRGATTVRAGELRVTGSLAGSATNVLSGATLSGNGTVGGLVARSGATVSPGANGLGMLGVNGAIQLQSGSTLRLQVQAPNGSDMLIGNGTMQLGGTAAITNLGGTYAFNSNYLLLQASGGRTGTFDTVTGFGEFGILYRPQLVYTANQVLLRMAPNLLTNIVGATPLTANQRSVVSRIDAAVTAGYNPQPLFNVYALPNAQQPNAFDQLSGEVYATAAGVGIEQERLVREAVLGRIGAVASASRETTEWGNGAGAWGQVFGSWGDGKRDGNAARYESDRQGFITGIDYGNANGEGSWRIGAFGMHMTSKVSVDARGSRTEVEQTGGGLYAGVNSGGLSVAMGASVTGVDLTSVRNIVLPGFAETNRGRGDGRAVQGFAELSYAIDAGNATYRPFASVAAGSFKLDALTETGGAAALAVRRQSYSSGSITIGADGVVRMGKVQLSGTLAGRVQVGDRDPAAQIALAAAPAQAFTVRGVQLDSFALAARLDATLKLGSNADLSLGYTGLIGNDTADHGARATLSVRF